MEFSLQYEVTYVVKFHTAIREHQSFKEIWQPSIRQDLLGKPDPKAEAIEYDKKAVGVSQVKEEETLVEHVPFKLSSLMKKILNSATERILIVKVSR